MSEEDNDEEKKSSNLKSIIWTVIWIGVIIGSVFLFFFLLQVGLNTQTPITVVSGRSMENTYYEGDLLIIQGKPYNSIVPGDHYAKNGSVIVYKSSYSGDLIVHRVTDVRFNHSGNEKYEFQTWGDNNPTPDIGWQSQDNVMGVVIFRIPFIGWVSLAFTKYPYNIVGYSIIGLIIVILIFTSFDSKKEKEKEKEKENNNIKEELVKIYGK
ncbi:MAG: signal peptidase I [Promethearchaeota archaeon]|nr:MAG: signal peptidase I [Candidatus Lokiarchaeota archaeon]